jgi:cytidylate kinase
MNFKYDNIAISGGVAVGKSTLLNNLKSYLSPYEWKFESIGDIHRAYLKDNIMPEATRVSDDFDRKIEKEVERVLTEEKHVAMQSWICGFVARDIPKTLKVLLVCEDNHLRIDRVANRDKITMVQAGQFIKQREEGNIGKYKRLYGDYNFWDPKYYNIVIDTYACGPLETTGIVLDALGYDQQKIEITRK